VCVGGAYTPPTLVTLPCALERSESVPLATVGDDSHQDRGIGRLIWDANSIMRPSRPPAYLGRGSRVLWEGLVRVRWSGGTTWWSFPSRASLPAFHTTFQSDIRVPKGRECSYSIPRDHIYERGIKKFQGEALRALQSHYGHRLGMDRFGRVFSGLCRVDSGVCGGLALWRLPPPAPPRFSH
jgi:hypothetical protein